jgi:hypothetical protein
MANVKARARKNTPARAPDEPFPSNNQMSEFDNTKA